MQVKYSLHVVDTEHSLDFVPLTLGNSSRHTFLLRIVLFFHNWIRHFELPHAEKVNQFALKKNNMEMIAVAFPPLNI